MNRHIIRLVILVSLLNGCSSHKSTLEDNENSKVWGLDLSHYQKITSWTKLAAQKPGFIFLKATEGSSIVDEKYEEYYKKVRELNIIVGSYHFFTYRTSGSAQAERFMKTAIYKKGDLPLVLDAEYAKQMPDRKTVVKDLTDFIQAIYKQKGIYPIVYCNYRYYNQYLKAHLNKDIIYWIVDYQGRPNCNWTFWQTTDEYRVAGIRGKVDFNLFCGTKKELNEIVK